MELKPSKMSTVMNPDLPTVWVDTMSITIRTEPRVAMLRFGTVMPEAAYEACRLQTSVGHLRAMVDVICPAIDYYPEKQKKKKKQ